MSDPLQTYHRKRDFARTAEPRGRRARPSAEPIFVVQEHHARRLHYDFRLEVDGVLRSWAVPQGPSEAPGERRLAVQVEDHPLDYADFEGEIPKGQYGGGTVRVWDRGTWSPVGDARAGLEAGKLKFELRGGRLRGRWTLVRMRGKGTERQPPWLLIREKDAAGAPAAGAPAAGTDADATRDARSGAARPSARRPSAAAPARPDATAPGRRATDPALPDAFVPQLATLVDAAPEEPGWIWEMKFDGYRLLARVEGADVRLVTRNGVDWTARLPHLVEAIRALGVDRAWLDGEIVVAGPDGAPDFQRLQNAFEASRTRAIRWFLFDAPYLDGEDLRARPLAERRERLRAVLEARPQPALAFSEDFAVEPGELLASACRLRMEGLIGKRIDAPYESRRAPTWIKLKCTQRQEFVVGGFTELRNGREGIGALLLGVHDANGALRYAGNVGTGFDLDTRLALRRELLATRVEASPFADAPRNLGATWVAPERVAEVSFAEWTRDGRVRYASFHGMREDKPASAIVREHAAPRAKLAAAAGEAAAAARPAPAGGAKVRAGA
ncbi:MAG TPA: non-homologous end-joining DNA ligase, partial [Burkholderiaceae bacterium]|nr:non-homologous end-joining DNA ligase [Burkholderiaceae bacterium]